MAHPEEVYEEALRLRKEERLSLNEIRARLGVSKGTLSVWLRGDQLTAKEKCDKMRKLGSRAGPLRRFSSTEVSKFWNLCPNKKSLTTLEKARIAEAAILFRATVLQLAVYTSPFDGDRADWIIEHKDGKLEKLQVRWALKDRRGAFQFSLRKSAGRNKLQRFQKGDFDHLIGYELRSDTAFVYTWDEVEHLKNSVAASLRAAEAWHKIIGP